MTEITHTLRGALTDPDVAPLPGWAQGKLHLTLWDRDDGPESPILTASTIGAEGRFLLEVDDDAATRLAMVGHREGPGHLVTVGWGSALDPALAVLPWPSDWAARELVALNWGLTVTLIGYVEQLHLLEVGALPLAVLELAGYTAPVTYRRLPPLPLPALDDRHGLHTDRRLDDAEEQVAYLLADAESPLAAAAQDALVSGLRVVCESVLAPQAGAWHEIVNVPLLLESLTLIAP